MIASPFKKTKRLILCIIVALIASLVSFQAESKSTLISTSTSDSTLDRLVKIMPKGYYVLNEKGFQTVVSNQLQISALEQKLKLTEKSLFDTRVESFSFSQKLDQSEKNLSTSLQYNSELTRQITGLKIQKWGLVGLVVLGAIKSFSP